MAAVAERKVRSTARQWLEAVKNGTQPLVKPEEALAGYADSRRDLPVCKGKPRDQILNREEQTSRRKSAGMEKYNRV